GTEVSVEQETSFPETDTSTLTFRPAKPATFAVRLRVPAWAPAMSLAVNGASVPATRDARGWAVVERRWNPGDRLSVKLPMALALAPVDAQHPKRVAVKYGPVVLVREQSATPAPSGDLSRWIERRGAGLEFAAPVAPRETFVPFYKVGGGAPYEMYFDL